MAPPRTSARASKENQANSSRASGDSELRSYRLHERLGQEELATVYRATHTILDRPVLVYLLRRTDWISASRFQLAARLAARLSHPHLLPVIDAGHDERYGDYLVTPQITGRRLDELLEAGALEPTLALRIVSQIGEALDALHSQQVIHRDVQPANIRLSSDEVAYLTNLSLASSSDAPDFSGIEEADYLTAYSAPEQSLRAADATPAMDLYSLGAVLYHMLSGEVPPDPSHGPPSLAARHPDLASVDRVLARLMNADPKQRYASAAQATAALRQALRQQIDAATEDMIESEWQTCAEWLENPLEQVLGPLLDQAFLSATRSRADLLHRAGMLRRLINHWSSGNMLRRRALGSLIQPQQILSYNVYFYELRTAYETRTQPEPRRRPFTGGTPPLGGSVPDLWEVQVPEVDLYDTTTPQPLVLPNAERLQTCPDCTRGRVVCKQCNGTGEVPRQRKVTGREGDIEYQELAETCPTCRGYRTQPCPTCEGSGQLLEEQIFVWSRRARLLQNTDDLAGLPERALTAQAALVFEGAIDIWDTRWHSVEPLRELINAATADTNLETRLIGSALTIRGTPVTEVEYMLQDRIHQLIVLGNPNAFDIYSDRGGYDTERIALYAALALLVVIIAGLVVFTLV